MPNRSRVHDFVTGEVFNNTQTEFLSNPLQMDSFLRMRIYLSVVAANAGAKTLNIQPQYSDDEGVTWFGDETAPFNALDYDQTDIATSESYAGETGGRLIRFKVTAAGTTATETFTVSVSGEFYES